MSENNTIRSVPLVSKKDAYICKNICVNIVKIKLIWACFRELVGAIRGPSDRRR